VRHLGRLRTRLAIAFGAGLLVAIANVLTTAALMFLNPHDLTLLVLLLVFSAGISLMFALLATSALTTNLEILGTLARRLANGELDARARLHGSDEVAQLGTTLDEMATQLEAAFSRQRAQETARRDFVIAVSHDLRTPLAATRAMVEALLDGVVTEPVEVKRYLALIGRETQHLSRLIDDLFELGQIESGALRLTLTSVDPHELASGTASTYVLAAQERGLELSDRVPTDLPPIAADPVWLGRVLRNLMDNALRHTPRGGIVLVDARHTGRHVEFRVSDSGPGIPVAQREHIFERFYRGEPSRYRGDGTADRAAGAGLGLAIARGLVEAHGGRIWVEDARGGGAVFGLTIPVLAAEPDR
jgi:two-component system, OmpR family, sensor histidine kinase SaeS